MEDSYLSGTGLSSLINNPDYTRLYRGEGAFNYLFPTKYKTPWQGTWYTTSLPYASMFSDMQGLSGVDVALGKNATTPGIIRQLDVELPFGSYETSPNPTINQLLADKEFINTISADSGTSLDNAKIVKVMDQDGNIKYITEAQRKLTDARPPNVFSLNYPQEFVNANSKVDLLESFKNLIKNSYKTWSPDAGNYFTATYDSPFSSKFQIPSWQMAKNMAQDFKVGTTGIMSAYLNDVKKKYTPNWAKSSYINNPVTRGGFNLLKNVGWAGDALLQAAAIKDIYTGSSHVGDAVTNINKLMGAKFKDDGTVQTNIKDYQASLPKPKYNMPPKGAAGFNRGGIVSLAV